MPKYLIAASLTASGAAGVLKDGGRKRREAARLAFESVGGKMEAYAFTLGDAGYDALAIVDWPDNAGALAARLAITATGTSRATVTPLLTSEDVDEAVRRVRRVTED